MKKRNEKLRKTEKHSTQNFKFRAKAKEDFDGFLKRFKSFVLRRVLMMIKRNNNNKINFPREKKRKNN